MYLLLQVSAVEGILSAIKRCLLLKVYMSEQDEEVAAAVRAAIKVLRSRSCLVPSVSTNSSTQGSSNQPFEVAVLEEAQVSTCRTLKQQSPSGFLALCTFLIHQICPPISYITFMLHAKCFKTHVDAMCEAQ